MREDVVEWYMQGSVRGLMLDTRYMQGSVMIVRVGANIVGSVNTYTYHSVT